MNDAVTVDKNTGVSLEQLLALRHQTMSPKQLAAVGLTGLPGKVQGKRRGNGMDFDDLRRYHPGDDVRHMDWNVTARTRQPHIRLYREDRERAVTVAIDLRPSMMTGSQHFRADTACRLAAVTLWQASRNGDRCAAMVYTEQGYSSSRPRIAERGVIEALGLIVDSYQRTAQAPPSSLDMSLAPWIHYLNSAGRLAGNIILFSGLDNQGEGLGSALSVAARQQRLLTIAIEDPMETAGLPHGHYHYVHQAQAKTLQLNNSGSKQLKNTLNRLRAKKLAPWQERHLPFLKVSNNKEHALLQGLYQCGFL